MNGSAWQRKRRFIVPVTFQIEIYVPETCDDVDVDRAVAKETVTIALDSIADNIPLSARIKVFNVEVWYPEDQII